MTKEQKLESIRKACIAANPDLIRKDGMRVRQPRLADVLLAMQNKDGAIGVSINGDFIDCDENMNNVRVLPHSWRLTTDDLTQQSDECIDFLAELLAN